MRSHATVALAFVCAVGLASAALGASDSGAFAARLGSARRHGSSASGARHRSAGGGHVSGAVPSSRASELGTHHHVSVTSHCQNVPADNAAGTYQFVDKRCGDGATGSVPGCVGDKHDCRFCQTSIVPKHSRNEGWPTCPAHVCAELKALGCQGESSASKKEVLWQLAREKALAHNAAVKGVSVGKCATAEADRKIGTHQFSDAKECGSADALGTGCLGGGSTCRFCQLSNSKAASTGWPVCPDVVCKKWKVKGGGCEPPLSLVTVPPEHPPADFDVTAAMDEQTKKMKAFIHGQKESDAGDDEEDDAPRKSRRTRATGNLVVDLLQSEDRGEDGLDEHLARAYAKKASSKSKRHRMA